VIIVKLSAYDLLLNMRAFSEEAEYVQHIDEMMNAKIVQWYNRQYEVMHDKSVEQMIGRLCMITYMCTNKA